MPIIDITVAQEKYINAPEPFPALIAGLGAGKSFAGIMRLIKLVLSDPGANAAYYMPTYDLINLRAIPGMSDTLSTIGIAHTINRSAYTITIPCYGQIIFRSYDRPERIIAYEVAHSICDELDTLSKDKAELVWRKITERNRQKRACENTIGLVTTPDQGYSGFVYEKWEKMRQPGYALYKASTRSNPFLPKEYVENILSNYDPILAQLYLDGDFVSLTQNKVYHFFDRKKHHTQRVIDGNDRILHIGIDFNIGGCCSNVMILDNNNPVFVDEFTSYDTRDFVNSLIARYKGKTCIIYPDASGAARKTNASQSDIQIIQQAGFEVKVNHSNPAIRDRINIVNGLFAHDRLKINTDKCPMLTHALETQGYDKTGDPEKFDNHPAIDDYVDNFGYVLAQRFPIVRPMTQIRIAGGL